jgi:hypothetical protein
VNESKEQHRKATKSTASDAAEQGVKSAHRTFAEVLKKADPDAVKIAPKPTKR